MPATNYSKALSLVNKANQNGLHFEAGSNGVSISAHENPMGVHQDAGEFRKMEWQCTKFYIHEKDSEGNASDPCEVVSEIAANKTATAQGRADLLAKNEEWEDDVEDFGAAVTASKNALTSELVNAATTRAGQVDAATSKINLCKNALSDYRGELTAAGNGLNTARLSVTAELDAARSNCKDHVDQEFQEKETSLKSFIKSQINKKAVELIGDESKIESFTGMVNSETVQREAKDVELEGLISSLRADIDGFKGSSTLNLDALKNMVNDGDDSLQGKLNTANQQLYDLAGVVTVLKTKLQDLLTSADEQALPDIPVIAAQLTWEESVAAGGDEAES